MHILIYGAGNVGSYIGGMLHIHGYRVTLLGRERMGTLIKENNGLRCSNNDNSINKRCEDIRYFTDPQQVFVQDNDIDAILVTVKSPATEEVGKYLTENTKPSTLIVSFQNGVRNADRLKKLMPNHKVVTGMFPFSVVLLDQCHVHQASKGDLYMDDCPEGKSLLDALNASGVSTLSSDNMTGILYGKLLFNLNNPITALAGIPLRQVLSQKGYRTILAKCQQEALAVYSANEIVATSISPLPIWLTPYTLQLPDIIFLAFAGTLLSIDDTASSSMHDDLKYQRPTEIEDINGEISTLGKQKNVPTPVNDALISLIHEAESSKSSPQYSAALLWEKVHNRIQQN